MNTRAIDVQDMTGQRRQTLIVEDQATIATLVNLGIAALNLPRVDTTSGQETRYHAYPADGTMLPDNVTVRQVVEQYGEQTLTEQGVRLVPEFEAADE